MNERPDVWWLVIPDSDVIKDYSVATLDRESAVDVARERTERTGRQHDVWKLERVRSALT